MAGANARAVGSGAEQLAERYLLTHGLTGVHRNFNCRHGEIDLVMLDRQCLVFVEVRFRASNRFSRASLTVDSHKQKKLIRTAALYIAKRPRFATSVVRFDVVAIDADDQGERTIEWIQDAFRPGDSRL